MSPFYKSISDWASTASSLCYCCGIKTTAHENLALKEFFPPSEFYLCQAALVSVQLAQHSTMVTSLLGLFSLVSIQWAFTVQQLPSLGMFRRCLWSSSAASGRGADCGSWSWGALSPCPVQLSVSHPPAVSPEALATDYTKDPEWLCFGKERRWGQWLCKNFAFIEHRNNLKESFFSKFHSIFSLPPVLQLTTRRNQAMQLSATSQENIMLHYFIRHITSNLLRYQDF